MSSSNEEFTIELRNLRVFDFNNYNQFNTLFQARLPLNVWNEFRVSIESAINSYTQNQPLTEWTSSYKSLGNFNVLLLCIIAFAGVLEFGFLVIGVWMLGSRNTAPPACIILAVIIVVCGVIGCLIRINLSSLKEAYHANIKKRVNNAIQLLNTKYNGICQFHMERIYGTKNVDNDVSILLRIYFKITLCQQQVNQPQQMMVVPVFGKNDNGMKTDACPICHQKISIAELETHVNACLEIEIRKNCQPEPGFQQNKIHHNYKQWAPKNVLDWIMSLDDGKFKMYQRKLTITINTEQIDGNDICDLDKDDLHRLGIENFKLKKCLLQHIENLSQPIPEVHTYDSVDEGVHVNEINPCDDNEGAHQAVTLLI